MKTVLFIVAAILLWQMIRLHRAGRRARVLASTIAAMDRANAALAQQNEMLGEALQELTGATQSTSHEVTTFIATPTAHDVSDRPARRWNDDQNGGKPSLLWDESVRYDPATNEFLDANGKPI